MTARREDGETRYFIDLDLRTRRILDWGFDQRTKLAKQEPLGPAHLRIYVTRGQLHKLEKKHRELHESGSVT
ncbi:MAG TPA: hypothetical protein PK668_02395 [Myxococcota bacterium]|nr:hypothetical protein [Myxococcota bacterium]HRY94582.1 hypothetical protein [Myxococcota bacterium]